MATVFVATPLCGNAALRIYLAVVKLPRPIGLRFAISSWKLFGAVAVAVAATAAIRPLNAAARRHLPRWPRRTVTVIVPAVALALLVAAAAMRARPPNRYGIYPSFAPGRTFVLRSNKPNVPDQTITTNALGFRDAEWTVEAAPGVERLLLVGDSFVFGYGIASPEGMLGRRLDAALNGDGPRRWRVIDVSMLPSAGWYYVHALTSAARDVHPRVMVVSWLKGYDATAYDDQWLKFSLSPVLVGACETTGVLNDYMRFGSALGSEPQQSAARSWEQPQLRALLDRLVRFTRDSGALLVVWQPLGADPVFEAYRGDRSVVLVSNEDVAALCTDPRGAPRVGCAWSDDPTLAIAGDGHPTPRANAIFARAIAERIREALGGSR